MKKIRLGMIGGGIGAFIGDAHRRASRICNAYTLTGGVFDAVYEKSKEFAKQEHIDLSRVYPGIDEFIDGELSLPVDERIQAVSIVTPNYLHYPHAKKLLENDFHVICDKPVTMTMAEAEDLKNIVEKTGKVFCLTHTYTGYPMVRQIRELIKQGVAGDIQRVDVQYYQGWINPIIHGAESGLSIWRLDPKKSGSSSCMADIGVHAFNLIEYTTGLKVNKVLADLNNVSPMTKLDLDGNVLLRFKENLSGVLRASQVANGEENCLKIAIYGSKASFRWEQENPNYLYQVADSTPLKIYKPGNPYNTEFAEASHTLPFGHPEGIYEAFANLYYGTAKAIWNQEIHDGEFPTIEDGVRGMNFIESVVESNKNGNVWVSIKD